MGSAEEGALVGTLYMRVRLKVCWKRCLAKRATAFYGRKRVGKHAGKRGLPNTFSVCVEKRTGHWVRVYCVGGELLCVVNDGGILEVRSS